MNSWVLTDNYGRKHTYLRISLTYKCNLSCLYCPPPKISFPSKHILTSEEIIKVISIFAQLGITKVRFTGGEPLLRNEIVEIIKETKKIKGIEKVCVTTNGTLLKSKAVALKDAGLDSINVSLDTLDPERFKKITGSNKFYEVLDGIFLALDLGLKLKINTVVLSDLSMEEVDKFVKFAMDNSIEVRFIELMPHCGEEFMKDKFMSTENIEEYLIRKYKISSWEMKGVAKSYCIGKGRIGFISSVSHPFCISCNRLRLSSYGVLYRCLYDTNGLDLKPFLDQMDNETLFKQIKEFLLGKKPSYVFNEFREKINAINSMRLIGG